MSEIKLIIDNCEARLEGEINYAVIAALSKAMSYMQESARFSPAVKRGAWDGRIRLLSKKLAFPSGLSDTALTVLYSYGIKPTVVDNRLPLSTDQALPWGGPLLRDYQQNLVNRCLEEGRGMVKSCTGSGKSNCIAALVGHYNTNTVVYVVSLDLLGQMHNTLTKTLNIDIGIVGGGKCDIKPITVCSVWSAAKAFGEKTKNEEEDVRSDDWSPSEQQQKQIKIMVESANLLILDEAQFAAAQSIQTIMNNSKSASNRFGFSGTPWRSDGADVLLTAAFGYNICDIKASDLIDLGWLVPPRISFKDIPQNNKIGRSWAEVKKEYIVNNAARNQILIDGTKKLLDMGRKPLVLFREISHGKALEAMLPADIKYEIVTGELEVEERDSIRDRFTNGDLDLILASSVYDQGVDLPALDALVLAGGGKSTAKALQRIGRVIRGAPGKTDALVLETWDQSHYVGKHSMARYQAYRYETGFKLSGEAAMKKAVGK